MRIPNTKKSFDILWESVSDLQRKVSSIRIRKSSLTFLICKLHFFRTDFLFFNFHLIKNERSISNTAILETAHYAKKKKNLTPKN